MKRMKIIAFITLLFCLLIAVPASFAVDNDTAIAVSDNQDSSISGDVLGSNDYYFNASVENDTGNGTIDNPYKKLSADRIKDNSIIHLAEGEYYLGLDFSKTTNNLTIIGQDAEKTIISYSGNIYPNFQVTKSLTLQNVTLVNLVISDGANAIVKADDVIFKNSKSSPIQVDLASTVIYLNRCTFINNTADFGSVFIRDGTLVISDSSFLDNYATFGGAITALQADLIINNITARNNRAKYDGGALYAMYGTISLADSTFVNNSANNGGALYIDDMEVEAFFYNNFTNNKAFQTAGAVYSIYNNITMDYNSFSNNSAAHEDDVADTLNMAIGNGEYIIFYSDPSTFNGTIPSYYSLRDDCYVTPVKDQAHGGNCWAFAAMGSLESCILKATGSIYDLSESNMKNLMAKFSDYGWKMDPNGGGYDKMGYGYLVGWLGPVNESDDVYSENSFLSPVLNSILHVQNVLFLDRNSYTDNDEIKKAILKFGGVATSIRWTGASIKGNTRYYSGTDGADHAVVIVGWDDNFSRYNFGKVPQGDGAWIIKNSHGTGSGKEGYWYVSYYDTIMAKPGKLENSYVFLFNDTIKYDANYQYDIAGKTDYFINYTNTVWYKNMFISNANEYLAAVSTYFMKETDWELSIYVNGVLRHTQSGHSPKSYSTIELTDFIQLYEGEVFEVMFKTTVDGNSGVPISEGVSLNKKLYSEGISFISYDGNNWQDLNYLKWTFPNHTYDSQVACIKAFTVFDIINATMELSFFNDTAFAVQAKVLNQYNRPVNVGNVTFSIDGKDYVVKVKNGFAVLNLEVDLGSYNVSAVFNAVGHNMAKDSIMIDVQSELSTLTSLNVLNEYNLVSVIANVLNQFGYSVNVGNVTFTLDGKDIVVDVVDGIAKLVYNFNDLGFYPISAKFNGIYYFSSSNDTSNVTVKSTISSSNETKTYSSSYSVSFLDNYGNPLKNTKVTFVLNSKNYYVVTDANGVANLQITLKPGDYEVKIINPINNETKIQNITVVNRITENSNMIMYYGAGKYYKVKVLDDNGNIAKGVAVTFTINNVKYTRTTNNYGYASLKIGLNPGKYKVTAEYKGFKASNTLKVKSTVVTKNVVIKKGKTARFYVKLLNSNGKILKNKKIKIKYRGKTYTFKTNYKGIASLKIVNTQKRGTYTIKTSYGKLSVKNKITIK